ncbi:hypothetical protein FRC98_18550 [Lujinxingia vulgaris]|uniref:Transposase IS200-like domain-containing protein n=1 Tax=Lujinxingia vulgaris TaxID=2600176 RepID=A0A5C6XBC3_9DELT|nr:hypothetical protein [Lujinxingia vulgaris]TXD34414.1 hypothetical protein FRC98_18550 [Lujinxingia vulgaris]
MSRRTHDREFLLRPDASMNAILRYEIARSAARHGLRIHGFVGMSNHVHVLATDVHATRSGFMRDAMAGVARARNRDLDRSGYFWDARGYHDMVVLDQQALVRQLIYIWLNPVRTGECDHPEEWPGMMILPRDWGKPMRVMKPEGYGRRSEKFVEFTPTPPPGYENMSLEEVQEHFETLLEEGLQEALAERESEKAGEVKVLGLPTSTRPSIPCPRVQKAPRFVASAAEVLEAAERQYKTFVCVYERVRLRWKSKKTGVVFPCGTLWLKQHARVSCQPAGPEVLAHCLGHCPPGAFPGEGA